MQLIFWCVFFLTSGVGAMTNDHVYHKQWVVVQTQNTQAVSGMLQRYGWDDHQLGWIKIGDPISVVVGKTGMAKGVGGLLDAPVDMTKVPLKREGDGKTPLGIFSIGPLFGIGAAPIGITLPYCAIQAETVCVDDPDSKYYNKMLDSMPADKDWRSAENMSLIPQYKLGFVIQYNTDFPKPGSGSCVFAHIWRNATTGTAGCVAMAEEDLLLLTRWLDAGSHPVMVLFPKTLYSFFKNIRLRDETYVFSPALL